VYICFSHDSFTSYDSNGRKNVNEVRHWMLFNSAVHCFDHSASVIGQWMSEWVRRIGALIVTGENSSAWRNVCPNVTLVFKNLCGRLWTLFSFTTLCHRISEFRRLCEACFLHRLFYSWSRITDSFETSLSTYNAKYYNSKCPGWLCSRIKSRFIRNAFDISLQNMRAHSCIHTLTVSDRASC
jgi:hypothetical protein